MTITTQGNFSHNLIGRIVSIKKHSGELITGEIVGVEEREKDASLWFVYVATDSEVRRCFLCDCIIKKTNIKKRKSENG